MEKSVNQGNAVIHASDLLVTRQVRQKHPVMIDLLFGGDPSPKERLAKILETIVDSGTDERLTAYAVTIESLLVLNTAHFEDLAAALFLHLHGDDIRYGGKVRATTAIIIGFLGFAVWMDRQLGEDAKELNLERKFGMFLETALSKGGLGSNAIAANNEVYHHYSSLLVAYLFLPHSFLAEEREAALRSRRMRALAILSSPLLDIDLTAAMAKSPVTSLVRDLLHKILGAQPYNDIRDLLATFLRKST